MAFFHVEAGVIQKGKDPSNSLGFALYLERLQTESPDQDRRFVEKEHGSKDLVASGYAHMPRWVEPHGLVFWGMADIHERGGEQRKGVVARVYQITLPRELSPVGQRALADDIRAVCFSEYPHTWAIHNPPAQDGGMNPHLHVMFSTRRDDTDRALSHEKWFSQRGVHKDGSWDAKRRLYEVREVVELLSNAALEREGHGLAVSARRLRERGLEREPVAYPAYACAELRQAVEAARAVVKAQWRDFENEANLWVWEAKKERFQLPGVDREVMVDLCRDWLWREDQSPLRQAERAATERRAMEREYGKADEREWEDLSARLSKAIGEPERVFRETDHTEQLDPHWRREWGWEEPHPDLDKVYESPIIGNKQSKIYHTPDHPYYGSINPKNRDYFDTAREAEEAGYRAARNIDRAPGKPWEARAPEAALAPEATRPATPGPHHRAPEDERDLDKVWNPPIIANTRSGIYHTPDHPNYGSMNPDNRTYFDTEREAQDEGYRLAKNIHHEKGKEWEERQPGERSEEREWTADGGWTAGQGVKGRSGRQGRGSVEGRAPSPGRDIGAGGVHVHLRNDYRER